MLESNRREGGILVLKLEITYPLLKRLVLGVVRGLADFSIDRVSGNSAIVKVRHGSFPFSLSVKVDVLSVQSTSEDPVVLKLGIPGFLLGLLKEYIKRDGVEISGSEMRIYPQRLSKILEGVRLSKLAFEENGVTVVFEEEQMS